MLDTRLYAITSGGRQRLKGVNVPEAFKEVSADPYLSEATRVIVREVRQTWEYPRKEKTP